MNIDEFTGEELYIMGRELRKYMRRRFPGFNVHMYVDGDELPVNPKERADFLSCHKQLEHINELLVKRSKEFLESKKEKK